MMAFHCMILDFPSLKVETWDFNAVGTWDFNAKSGRDSFLKVCGGDGVPKITLGIMGSVGL